MFGKRTRAGFIVFLACFLSVGVADVRAASADYDELVVLFEEFRDFQEAEISNGVPDYSPAAVKEKYKGLKQFQKRLLRLNVEDWPISQQVDYHLVRAEMNAVEFHHKVMKPWARDPGFYSMAGGDAGPVINAPEFFGPIFEILGPVLFGRGGPEGQEETLQLSDVQAAEVHATLKAIPDLYEQARENLTEPAADLAEFAIRNIGEEAEMYLMMAELFDDQHPAAAQDARNAAESIRRYVNWLEDDKHKMTKYSGLGKENYDWWMRNVQLSPWGWEDSNRIIHTEYDRVITFLKLEEHRNRNLPSLDVARSQRDWQRNLRQALHHVTDFLREEELMTIDGWVDPSDYYYYGRGIPEPDLSKISDEPTIEAEETDPNSPDSSIDTKVRQREILPGETHEYIGHMLDEQRNERLDVSPIRMADRHYNMASMRLEGWAVWLEESLVQAGVLDERPRKGREMQYLMNASHMSLSIPDMKMHANEITLEEARKLCAEIMPRGWTREHENMVWFEMQSNLRNAGGFHSNVVTGKAYFMKLFRERAQELGDDFVIKDFVDEFLSKGLIPMSLIRWEMTGDSSDVTLETEELKFQ